MIHPAPHAPDDARDSFLNFFAERGHTLVPSAPLLPHGDPTLMFVNAGMVPFKNYFTGAAVPEHKTAASVQMCVRAGGKHNDLDNVGYTARHHTFFEMLGNFSFGDYFKEQAIVHAHDYVFKTLALPRDRLLVTVYADDEVAADLWRKVAGINDARIIRIAGSDNFWSMGDTGPCGPCSEIFYDHGAHIAGGPPGTPEQDGDRFVEIWNLVFMQYEQRADGTQVPLPAPCVDTGMGLERINAVLQGTHDNYLTKTFRRLTDASRALTNAQASDVSHRVIADHLRASAFLIADGVLPAADGRGYVLRRIMRRAMRHAYMAGASEPLMHRLLPVLLEEVSAAYPHVQRAASLIEQSLRVEEERFRETLGRGLKLLDEAPTPDGVLAGETAFKLYDTYGFPLDLTADVLRERGQRVDEASFQTIMQRRKQEDRAGWVGSGEEAGDDALQMRLAAQVGATVFTGYEALSDVGTVRALLRDGAAVDALQADETGIAVFDRTCFYAESGGQVGDIGALTLNTGAALVTDTRKGAGDLFLHAVRVTAGTLRVGDTVQQQVDAPRRTAIRAAHSATHLLHEALRRVLGSHVSQKGSAVHPDRLRFDFSHDKPVSDAQIEAIEDLVNAVIRANTPVQTALMSPEDAIAAGALALFGEKYGTQVRVLSMPQGSEAFSVELCGGTHVTRTGDIGLLRVVSQSGAAAGVRRIEALTGAAALEHVRAREDVLCRAEALLKTDDVLERLQALSDEKKRLERELLELRRKHAADAGTRETIGAAVFDHALLHDVSPKDLPPLIDAAKAAAAQVVLRAAVSADGKVALALGTQAGHDAAALLRAAIAAGGGRGGGGRSDLAQGGLPSAEGYDAALDALRSALRATAG